MLSILAGTSAGKLVVDENGIFELNGQKYNFDVSSIPNSVFSYVEGTETDYNFTIQEADSEGNLTTKYYKIVLNPAEFNTSSSITWEPAEAAGDNTIAVQLPNNQLQYFKYTYTKPDNYTETSKRIDNTLATADVTDVVFKGISSSSNGGAIYNTRNNSSVNITADFIETASIGEAFGGVIYNVGRIGLITGSFISNYNSYNTGAVYNKGRIAGFAGDFINNSSMSGPGAIYNEQFIGDISGNFIGNMGRFGGAISNSAAIDNIIGDFFGNTSSQDKGPAWGGAIYNTGTISNLSGDYISNYVISRQGDAYGGAVYNNTYMRIGDSRLFNNLIYHINLKYNDQEMEVYIRQGSATASANWQIVSGTMTVDNESDFNQYKADSVYAYLLELSPDNVTAEDYVNINIKTGAMSEEDGEEYLSRFYQQSEAYQKGILESFKRSIIDAQEMINNAIPVTDITLQVLGQLNFYNSSFLNNYAQAANGDALGGAFYGSGIKITADNYTSIIDGNTANGEHNAFYVLNKTGMASFEDDIFPGFSGKNVDWDITINTSGSGDANDLVLTTSNNGIILVNDGIDGESGYSLGIDGDKGIDEETSRTPQYVQLNNSIANAGNIYVSSNTLVLGTGPYGKGEIISTSEPVTKMTLTNAAFDIHNGYKDEIKLAGLSSDNGYIHMDIDVENLTTDVLNINGDIIGTTNLILYPNSDKDIRGESILFAQANATNTAGENAFKVWRVYNSPYLFDVSYSADETNKKWSLVMNDVVNPDSGIEPEEPDEPEVPDVPADNPVTPDNPETPDVPSTNVPSMTNVAPEVIAFGALPIAGIEQTRNMVDNVGNQIRKAEANSRLWVNPTYYQSSSEALFDVDADIWGVEAGGDLQYDMNNRLGLFVSYRKGEYDMSGSGKHYRSGIGSEIDIDSYMAGLYYRYDKNNWYGFATVYGGMQEADLKTKDGVKSDTDGIEFGGSAEVGYDYALQEDLYLTPSVGIYYTQVNYDDAKDNVGKKAEYEDFGQVEIEAGVRLNKMFATDTGYANVYIKPSVVQTITDGGEVSISGLGKVESLDDETLGRVEIGGRYGISSVLSAYGWANYTFGSDYDATTFGVGLNYAF